MKITLETIGEDPFMQEVSKDLFVWAGDVVFVKGIVSKIVVNKHWRSLFVEIYMGEVEIANYIAREVVIEENRSADGRLTGYIVRKLS